MSPFSKLFISAAAFSLSCSALAGQTPQTAGAIVGITGQWWSTSKYSKDCGESPKQQQAAKSKAQLKDESPPPLHFSQAICPNTCVVGDGGTLTVEFGDPPTVFTCEGKADPKCPQPITKKCAIYIKPGDAKPKSLMAAFLAMISNPERYITPVSRGLEPHLAESVLSLANGSVDLAPAFADMNPAKYAVRIQTIAQEEPVYTEHLEWTGNSPLNIPVPDLTPGLYGIRLTAESEPATPEAWVLVDGPDRFATDSANFRSAVEETKSWPDEVDPRAPRIVLRAYLESLAKHNQVKP